MTTPIGSGTFKEQNSLKILSEPAQLVRITSFAAIGTLAST
jgi:hypothetical protein